MADLAKIVEDLSKLTVLEAAELSKLLEEKWGVSAAAPVAMAMPAGGAGGAAPAEAGGVLVGFPSSAAVRECRPDDRAFPRPAPDAGSEGRRGSRG